MAELEVKFPEIEVELIGQDGNGALIIGRVSKALRRAGAPEAAAQYVAEATSGDYDHLLQTTMRYVTIV